MGFKLEIKTENDAFLDNDNQELKRILLGLAEKSGESLDGSGVIWDINGNNVGRWTHFKGA